MAYALNEKRPSSCIAEKSSTSNSYNNLTFQKEGISSEFFQQIMDKP
jgi:hypothetical protein